MFRGWKNRGGKQGWKVPGGKVPVTEINTQTRLENLTLSIPEIWRISRHNGGPIKGPFEPSNTIVLWCMGVSSIWNTWLPRDDSLSDSYKSDRCRFFRPGTEISSTLPDYKFYIEQAYNCTRGVPHDASRHHGGQLKDLVRHLKHHGSMV